jgi:hypothetical protein
VRAYPFIVLAAVATWITAMPCIAQDVPLATQFEVTGVDSYDPVIPRPETVLGYVVGSRHTEPYRVVEYFQAVAEASARVTYAQHGSTHEGRPLIHAVVTTPENHERLESILAANRRLSDAPESVTAADISGMPAVVLLAYSVHGNEASGTEAAMLTLYHLAAGRGAVEGWLDNLVVVIDPMLNPDGRDRFVDWVNRNRGDTHTTDPQDREHQEPWPGGRTNHYLFDLNRDWLPARQPESRARLELFHHWRPQLVADFHEMGGNSTYFFQPGIQSRTHPNTPARNQEITAEIAAYHARALDRIGQMYFSEEVFDDFYYGKGSSYPDVNGAIGILFEQASSRALETETRNGPLSYAVTVRNQFATSLSTLAAARDLRLELLSNQQEFYTDAPSFAAGTDVGTYALDLRRGRARALELASLLQAHRVQVYELGAPVTIAGERLAPGDALAIPAAQPQARLLDAMLSSTTEFADSLFYDVSAWTFPYAFDVDVWSTRSDVSLGEEWSSHESPAAGRPADADADAVAFLTRWDGLASARYVGRLQRSGLTVRLMTDPFVGQGRETARRFEAGTIVVPASQRGLSADSVAALVRIETGRTGLEAFPVVSGLTPEGPDLGGSSSVVLSQPAVALLTGRGTSSTRTGETWEFLSSLLELPVSLIDLESLDRKDLSTYDVVVFAGGSAPDSSLASLGEWIEGGGRLIAAGSAIDDVVAAGWIELTERPLDLDSLTAGVSWRNRRAARGAHVVGGTILMTHLDATHPLTFGIGDSLPTFRSGSAFYDAGQQSVVVGRYADAALLSGYISDERLALVPGSASVLAARHGRGAVIALMDEPVFRGFWLGSSRLLANAVFLGGAF